MTQPPNANDVESAILGVYQAPLDEFVSRRDALAKQLRAGGQRDDAARVKALRKPSRMAWVLDAIAHENPASIEQLVAAITEAQSGADLRIALEAVKEAVQAVAAVGARVAVRAGQPIEPNAIVLAVHAVIGNASAFAEFRAGRLVEVPEGGGLDMLSALTVSAPSPKSTSTPVAAPPSAPTARTDAKADARADLAKAAREELRRAETLRGKMRDQSERAAEALRQAEKKSDAAERALLDAQADLKARRDELERARRDAESAVNSLRDAEGALDSARASVAEIGEA